MIAVPSPEVGATVEVVAVEYWMLSLSWALRLIAVDVAGAADGDDKLLLKQNLISLYLVEPCGTVWSGPYNPADTIEVEQLTLLLTHDDTGCCGGHRIVHRVVDQTHAGPAIAVLADRSVVLVLIVLIIFSFSILGKCGGRLVHLRLRRVVLGCFL